MLYFLMALFIIIGVLDFLRKHGFDQYLVAGRSQNATMVTLSMLATVVGGSATMGMVTLSGNVGFPAIWLYLSGTSGLMLLGITLARRVRETGAATLADLVGMLIGSRARALVAVIIVTGWTGIVAAQFVAAGRIVDTLTDLDATGALVAASVVITIYAILGGQSSIMKTDALQFFVMVGALLFAAGYIWKVSPAPLANFSFEFTNEKFPISKALYFLFIYGGSYLVGPDIYSRLFTSADDATAKRGALSAAIILPIIGLVVLFIGLSAAKGGADPKTLLTVEVVNALPSWAGAWLLGGLFCAVVSSADTCLVTAAGIIEHDILKGRRVSSMRIFIALFGGASLAIGLWRGDIIGLLLMGLGVFTTGVVAPVATALYFRGKREVNRQGLFIAILLGGSIGLTAGITGIQWLSFLGLGVSTAISLISALSGQNAKELQVKPATTD